MTYDEDDLLDEEWVEDESDSGDDLLLCPNCRQFVHEDTQQCPHCGNWITPVYPQGKGKRFLWIVVVILLIACMTFISTC